MIKLRTYQEKEAEDLRAAFRAGFRSPLLVAPTGSGKCLGRGTPVLMFNGTIKPVEDVIVGDWLMGPDSRPRRVLSVATGQEQLYRIVPTKGDPYVVNASHILSLRMTPTNKLGYDDDEHVLIEASDYIKKSQTFKHCAKTWRAAVDFTPPAEAPEIPPYILGLWLGDGNTNLATLTTADVETEEEWTAFSSGLGMLVRKEALPKGNKAFNLHSVVKLGFSGGVEGGNPFMQKLRHLRVLANKHIPHRYLTGSRSERLEMLAGLLDSDGHLSGQGYDFINKNRNIADGAAFIARSLGLAAYVVSCKKSCSGFTGRYWRVSISGDTHKIPCRVARKKAMPRLQKKNVLRTGMTIEDAGFGDYFGFEIDGDRLFMLGDFTVTHNTVLFSYIATRTQEMGRRTSILVHREELLTQVSETLDSFGTEHGLISSDSHYDRTYKTHVASVQTLVRRLARVEVPDLVICDEAHHCIAGSSWGQVIKFWREKNPKLNVIGVTATPERLGGEGLRDMFDTMVLGPTVADLIASGSLCKYRLFAPPTAVDMSKLHTRGGDFMKAELEAIMANGAIVGNAITHYTKHCNGAPAAAFCVSRQHALDTAERFRAAGYRAVNIDGSMSKDIRRSLIADVRRGAINVVTSCDLLGEGFDVPGLHAAILLRPTQSLALYLQQIGRVMRPAENKPFAVILDHVGNSKMHGLPDDERAWSLDGRPKKDRDKSKQQSKSCKKCFAANNPAASKCRECGEPFLIEGRKIEEVDGELTEVEVQRAKKAAAREQGMAKDIESLVKLGTIRGYKDPRKWANAVLSGRQRKGW